MRITLALCVLLTVSGCVEPNRQSSISLSQGHIAAPAAGLSYVTHDDGTRATAEIYDPISMTLIATSTLTSNPELAGTVSFAGAAPYSWVGDPSSSDLAVFEAFAVSHGSQLVALAAELHAQHAVDANDPSALRRYAAIIQLIQALEVMRGQSLPDLDSWLAGLSEPPESGTSSEPIFRIVLEPELGPLLGFPLVAGIVPFGAAAAMAPLAAPLPNVWHCVGTPYAAGCRGMCGASCDAATVTTATRCSDNLLYRDTTYAGITNECCGIHDDCYDACSRKYKCGQGKCPRVITFRGRTFTIQVPCRLLLETCRRGCDAGCALCAVVFGYDPADCALWALGAGPGKPISFIDSTIIGKCCSRCNNMATMDDGYLPPTGCSCDDEPTPTPIPTPYNY